MLGDLPFVGSEEIKRLCERFSSIPPAKLFYPLQERSFRPPYVLSLSLERKVQKLHRETRAERNILMDYKDEIITSEAPDCHFET